MSLKSLLVPILLNVLLVLTHRAQAQWVPVNGFVPGNVTSIVMAGPPYPSHCAIAGGRLFRETSQGWQPIATQFTDATGLGFDGQTLYLGTSYQGLKSTTDMGNTWTDLNVAVDFKYHIASIACYYSTIIAATFDSGLVCSSDGGKTWSVNKNGFPYYTAALNVWSIGGGEFYAAANADIYRSTDNGQSWKKLSNAWPIVHVLCAAQTDKYLYIGTEGAGVWRSPDRGSTWACVSVGLADSSVHAILTGSDSVLIATDSGVYLSIDDGVTWKRKLLPFGYRSVAAFCFFKTEWNTIYAGTNQGIAASPDGGNIWGDDSKGLSATPNLYSIAAIGSHLIAGTSGIYVSSNHGDSWLRAQGIDSVNVRTFLHAGQDLFAGGDSGGVFISMDSGLTWHQRSIGLPTAMGMLDSILWKGPREHRAVHGIAQHGSHLFAATGVDEETEEPPCDSVFCVSSDYGATWHQDSLPFFGAGPWVGQVDFPIMVGDSLLAFVPANSEDHYVYDSYWHSPDDGVTWAYSVPDSNFSDCRHGPLHDCYPLASACGHILSAGYNGIWVSSNMGQHWQHSLQDSDFTSIISVGQNVIAGSSYGRVYVSTDTGNTWKNISEGIPSTSSIISLAEDAGFVYASTNLGIYRRPSSELGLIGTTVSGPSLATSTREIEFGTRLFNHDSSTLIVLANNSGQGIEITSLNIVEAADSDYSMVDSKLGKYPLDSLRSGDSIAILITFHSHSPAHTSNATLVTQYNEHEVLSVNLTGASIGASGVAQGITNDIGLTLSPNPTNGLLSIGTDRQLRMVSFSDQLGRSVYPKIITRNQLFDFSCLAPGTYYITVAAVDSVSCQRIVKW